MLYTLHSGNLIAQNRSDQSDSKHMRHCISDIATNAAKCIRHNHIGSSAYLIISLPLWLPRML